MNKQMIKQRQAYHERKAAELDRITDANKYTKRLARLMKYHRLISELVAVEVKKLQSDESQLLAAFTVNELLQELRTRVDVTGSMKVEKDHQAVLREIQKVGNGIGSESLISLLSFAYGKKVMFENIMNQEGENEK